MSLLSESGVRMNEVTSCPQVLLMAMKDMNIAKLTSTDLPLFSGITQDLFPAVETPVMDYGKVVFDHVPCDSFLFDGLMDSIFICEVDAEVKNLSAHVWNVSS